MAKNCITNSRLEETGFNYTMSLIQGKYKMFILYTLMEFSVVRFNEMQKYIGTITYKTLSSTLKQLEADGLITGGIGSQHTGSQGMPRLFSASASAYAEVTASPSGLL